MVLQISPYVVAMTLTGGLALVLAGFAAQRRSAPGWVYFVLAMFAVGWWSLAYALELAVIPFSARIFFHKLSYAAAQCLAPLWLLFSIHDLTHQRRLTFLRQIALFLLPAALAGLGFSGSFNSWIWARITPLSIEPGSLLVFQYGPAFWVGVAYAYILMLTGSLLLGRRILQSTNPHRSSSSILLIAAIIPWTSNFLSVSRLNPFPGLDLTPPAFAVSGLLVSAALFRYHFLELIPIAYDTLFASMENEVLVLDGHNRLLEANPSARRLFGLDGSHIGQVMESWLANTPEFMCLLQDSHLEICEICFQSNGLAVWRSVQSAPFLTGQKSKNEHLSGRLIVLNDITERKQTEVQIHQAHQRALEASRMKSRLLANVSHDLRSPLTAIMGFSDMLRTGMLGEVNTQQGEALDQILESAGQQLSFVNNLIGQAQLETGQVILNYQHFTYQDLLQPLKSTVGMMAARKNLDLVFEVDPDLPVQLYGDPYWLRQVLLNLVNNAIKFTSQGRVTVRLYQGDCMTWSIQVKDTGIGIPAEKQKEVFEPFRQLKEGRSSQTGSGLGLAIVAQLVDLMKGETQLESQPGLGSTFTVSIPYEPPMPLKKAISFQDTTPVR